MFFTKGKIKRCSRDILGKSAGALVHFENSNHWMRHKSVCCQYKHKGKSAMFVNPTLGDIFLINTDTSTIHAASRLSDKCGINGEQNGHFGILPCEDKEREIMIQQFGREYPELHLCPHCFAGFAAAEEKKS